MESKYFSVNLAFLIGIAFSSGEFIVEEMDNINTNRQQINLLDIQS